MTSENSTILRDARRIVVKVGSSLVTNEGRGLDEQAIGEWCRQLSALVRDGRELIMVSSGAIAEGMKRLGWTQRPHAINELQAAAAVVPVVRPRLQRRPLERMTHLPLWIFCKASGSEQSPIQVVGMAKPVTGSFAGLATVSVHGSSIGIYDLVYGRDGDGSASARACRRYGRYIDLS